MSWDYTPYAALSLGTALLSGALAVYSWRRRGVPGAGMAALFMAAVFVWGTAAAIELGAVGLEAHLFWSKATYPGIVLVPLTWFGFAAGYTGREEWASRRNMALLSVVPFITLALVFTNERHGLIWSSTTVDDSGPFATLSVEHGPWFWFWLFYGYALLAVGAVLIISMLARSGDLYGKQGIALLFGVAAPWVGNALFVFDLFPVPNYDPTPSCLFLSGAAMALALSRYGLLDVIPVARSAVVEGMDDGVMVLDSEDRVLDANPAALTFCRLPASSAIGLPAEEVVSVGEILREIRSGGGTRRQVKVAGETPDGTAPREYEVSVSSLQTRGRRAVRFVVVRDTTERAERELLFRLLVENASDVVTIYGPDAGFRYVSPSIGRVLGYRPEEAIRLGNAGGIIHPDEAGDVARRFEEIWAAPGVSLPVAFRMRHKDGSWRHMEGVLNNLLSDPEVGGVVASWRDVTARIEAEKEVRRLNAMLERRIVARTAELEETLGELASSEERYRALFENAVEGIFQTDAEGRLTTANPAMARIFGHESPGSLIAATKGPVATLYADEEKAREVSATLVNEGKVSASEARATRRDGSEVWISVSARAVREGPGGEILRYEGTVQDISERVGARRTLEKRVAALTRLAGNLTAGQPVENTLDAVTAGVTEETSALACSVTLLDQESDRLLLVAARNLPEGYMEALSAAWGSGGRSLVAGPLESLKPGFVRGARGMYLQEPLYSPLHPFLWDAGWEGIFVVPLVSRGQALGVISAYYPPGGEPAEDERTFIRAVADQAAVAVENARYFERFLAAARGRAVLEERQRISRELHDSVSQALYGIALGSRTARTLLDRGDPARAVEPLEYVHSLSEAGLAEMRALIFELRPEALESEGLVSALEKQAAALRARHDIGVNTTLGEEPAMPPETKEALYRIAQEALQNTVKHAGAANVHLNVSQANGTVTLDVSDDGGGFDPTRDFPGHLGLRSMRERAERLGGTLRIESAPGEGTRVRVRVPPEPGDA